MKTEPENGQQTFRKVIEFGSATCIGVMAAFLEALKQVNPEILIVFGWTTALAFAAGAGITVAAWRWGIASKMGAGADERKGSSIKTRIVLVATVLGLLFVFANPLKTLSSEKRKDMIIGTSLALAVLSVVGVMFYKVVRFLDDDSDQTEASSKKSKETKKEP